MRQPESDGLGAIALRQVLPGKTFTIRAKPNLDINGVVDYWQSVPCNLLDCEREDIVRLSVLCH